MAREDKESTHEEIGSSAESFTGTVNTGGGATYFGTRILPYPDSSTVSGLQSYPDSSYGSEMHVCTLTHSGLLHASGLSAVSWLTACLDLDLQVRAYLSTTAVLRAY